MRNERTDVGYEMEVAARGLFTTLSQWPIYDTIPVAYLRHYPSGLFTTLSQWPIYDTIPVAYLRHYPSGLFTTLSQWPIYDTIPAFAR
jgi:hypothetical protein